MSSSRRARIVAWLALFVSLGGSVYAAAKIDGKTIRKSSIPANRVKPDSLTGAQVNEAKLATVPGAARAAVADLASEVARTTEAATARRAPSARTAEVAERAGTAASAETATRARSAGIAEDTELLGELAFDSLQRACDRGAVTAAITVTPGVGDPDRDHPAIGDQFNCTGAGVSVSRPRNPQGVPIEGEYEVDFGREGVGFAVVSAVQLRNVAVIAPRGPEGNYRVKVFNTQTDGLARTEAFTIALFR